jgi:hypothetical protein
MAGDIIRLKKPRLDVKRQSTAASGAPPDGQSPMFETTLMETLGIRKFIEMSIADIRTQLEKAARDGTPRKLFLAQQQNAFVITAWLTSALMMVDGMLASAAATQPTTLADEMRTEDDSTAT